MKLLRVGKKGQEKPAALDKNGKIRDLSDHINDLKAGLSAGVRILGCLYGYSLDENNLNKLNYPYIRDISEIYSHINI